MDTELQAVARAMAEKANDYDNDVLQWECWSDDALCARQTLDAHRIAGADGLVESLLSRFVAAGLVDFIASLPDQYVEKAVDLILSQQAENARLRQALEKYATDLCENANQDWCGMLSAVECAGCLARQALKDAA